ncbi:MAG TPA: peptidoglycan DD-metalloendopeptidase family protein [Gammaproteobacteria bacterium]|jgi:murein DD-endopeptidase MepM/ murein hydrolase activator NlpD|nr:peptidoglycan DD-metalloendopeptidase family protein [Gammaproteobacteria bacterium]
MKTRIVSFRSVPAVLGFAAAIAAAPACHAGSVPAASILPAMMVQATVPKRVAGRIQYNLYRAARRAGLSRALTSELIRIFAGRVDFRHDISRGDRFVAIYRETSGDSAILAAELDLANATLRVFRDVGTDGKVRYFTAAGRTLTPTLLRTPVDYTRVSSPFSLHRLNPVLHIYRPHYGVDLAAPTGTPVHAAGNGEVTFRGRDGGYGNLIIIHNRDGKYSTRYAHLLRFAKGIRVGARVRQGEVIGYVGATGLTTGPHLHFEIRVDGVAENPLTVKLPDTVPDPQFAGYEAMIMPLIAELDATVRLPPGTVARNDDDSPRTPAFLDIAHKSTSRLCAAPADSSFVSLESETVAPLYAANGN